MSFQTDRNRVRGLGTAHEGAKHWWHQRLTSIALVPLALLFLFPFARALGHDHATVLGLYRHTGHALVAVLFIAVAFLHLAWSWPRARAKGNRNSSASGTKAMEVRRWCHQCFAPSCAVPRPRTRLRSV